VLALGAIAVALSLSGCTGGDAGETPSPSADAGTDGSGGGSGGGAVGDGSAGEGGDENDGGSGTDEVVDDVTEPVSCEGMLDQASLDHLAAEAPSGLSLVDGWGEKLKSEGLFNARFVDLGGVACAMGYVGTDNVVDWGWSPIDAATTAEVTAQIGAQGAVPVADDRGSLLCISAEQTMNGSTSCWLLRSADWFYASDVNQLAVYVGEIDAR
jgi:hypothetical protein